MMERIAILAVVLIVGVLLGVMGRRAARAPQPSITAMDLPPGLVLFTAPFCAGCTTIRASLDRLTARVTEISVIDDPTKVRALDIRTAPTLLRVGSDGRERERLRGASTLAELEAFIRRGES